jgi:RHS repeat-associated protein
LVPLNSVTYKLSEYEGIMLNENNSFESGRGDLQIWHTNHKHAVTAMGSESYTYDANGNQITQNVSESSYTFSYDAENHLVSVGGSATAAFYYDGDGNRVKATVGGITTTYIGNPSVPSGQCYFEWVSDTSNMKKYYYAGSTRVAMRTGSSTINYLLGDHSLTCVRDKLGITAITTDSSGSMSAEIRYYPWGTERYNSGSTPTKYHFTGQRLESSIGLYYYGARWYDPAAGRFIQADSIVPGAGDSQAYDHYAYTNNNPVKYTDPTGHRNCEEDGYNCPGDKIPAPVLTVSPVTSSDAFYTATYNNTMDTITGNASLPQNNPNYSGSYTGYTTVGMNQISVSRDTYDTTDQRYRLPGLPNSDQVPTAFDLFRVVDEFALPYANSALARSAQPNLGVTVNYNISFGNPSTIGISSIGVNNSSGLPVTLINVSMSGSTTSQAPFGQTISSGYSSFPVNINADSFYYMDVNVQLYSTYDYDDLFSGYRYINTRIWNNGTAVAK